MARLGMCGGTIHNSSDTHGTVIGKSNVIGQSARIDKSCTGYYIRYCTAAAFTNKELACTLNSCCTSLEIVQPGTHSLASGYGTTASGRVATAMGSGNVASGDTAIAMGYGTCASGHVATAMGYCTCATGPYSTAMGYGTCATGSYSTATGQYTGASSYYATASGVHTLASGYGSTAMGNTTCAAGSYSTAMGYCTTASGSYDFTMGHNGPKARIQMCTGKGYFNGGTSGSGADYAEMFHSVDAECIPKAKFVSFKECSDCVCPGCNDIVGITSVSPSVMGDAAPTEWAGKYLKDEIGQLLRADKEVSEDITVRTEDIDDKDTFKAQVTLDNLVGDWAYKVLSSNEGEHKITVTYTQNDLVLNPDYDPDTKYVLREDRPEWNEIGLVGKLWVEKADKDGTFNVGDYVTSDENGLAVPSTKDKEYAYRVLEVAVDHIKVYFK